MLLGLTFLAICAFMPILTTANFTHGSTQPSLISRKINFSKDPVTHDVTHAKSLVGGDAFSLSHRIINHEIADWQIAEGMLDEFIIRLKTFIKKRHFDYIQFESQSGEMKNRLSDIDNLLYSATPAEQRTARFYELSDRVRFAWHALGEMESAVSELIHYRESHSTGRRWVFRVIESNIVLYALLDVKGHVDLSIKHVARNVFLAWREVIVWDNQLEKTDGVLSELRNAFQKHKESVEQKIREMVVQLPDGFDC